MALSDVLLKTGLAPAIARQVLDRMLIEVGDEERKDRMRAFDSTLNKISNGQPTVGWDLLEKRLPGDVYSQMREWLAGDTPAPALTLADVLRPRPPSMTQSMALINGRAYAASCIWTRENCSLLVVRDDMTIFSALKDTRNLSELPFTLDFGHRSLKEERWFGQPTQPKPEQVFSQIAQVIDHFMDFDRSFGSQREIVELAACYAMGTWFLPAFSTIGYLFANGTAGSGKTRFLQVIQLCFRAISISGNSTNPAIREQASIGGTICLDDDETLGQPGESECRYCSPQTDVGSIRSCERPGKGIHGQIVRSTPSVRSFLLRH